MNRSSHVQGLLALMVALAVATPAMADPAAERAAALANNTCAAAMAQMASASARRSRIWQASEPVISRIS